MIPHDSEHSTGFWECALELRQAGNRRQLLGKFPYNSTAVVADRGRQRKERLMPHAFRFSAEVAIPLQEAIQRGIDRALLQRVDLLRGHDFDKPIASTWTGSLRLRDTAAALEFEADLPNPMPSWADDTVRAIESGLATGISPGFRVPPPSAVSNAERLVPEPGSADGVMIREIREATLYEMSIVTRPAYRATELQLRADLQAMPDEAVARFWALGGLL